LAALAAVFLSVVGCTLPTQQGQSGNNKNIVLASPSPTPSPMPTPTQQFAASAPAFHIGEVGVGYTPVAMTATGGVQPYHWTISSGAVPLGLTLGNDGTLSGIPTAPGKYIFTIEAADSGDGKATIAGSITIAGRVNASLIPSCAKYCTVELGCVTVCGSFGTQTGGVGPFRYELTQGQVPSGTSLSGLSLTGTFTGQKGYLQFTVQVTDSLGASDTVSPTFWMYPHISLGSGSCYSSFYRTTDCTAILPISGGTPSDAFRVVLVSATGTVCTPTGAPMSPPPPMFSATVVGQSVKATVPAQPNTTSWCGYTGTVTLKLTDSNLCGASTYCSATATVAMRIQAG